MSVHITSGDLDEWSRRRDSEGHLPTLVRRLIMETVRPEWIRMPAAEGVSMSGLDGIVSVVGATHPYLPDGDSVWEIGTDQDQRGKAVDDYIKRTKQTDVEVSRRTTYVAVTNRKWSKGEKWVKDMKALGDEWMEIVVLTADELATWLDDCPNAEGWLREHLGKGSLGDTALNTWFTRWSKQTLPATPEAVLTAGRRSDVVGLLNTLDAPAKDAITIAATSVDEAVAFAAAALRLGPEPLRKDTSIQEADEEPKTDPDVRNSEHLEALRERAIVITDETGWRRWSTHPTPHILIPLIMPDSVSEAVEAGHHVILPKTARTAHEDGRLRPIDPHGASKAWKDAGLDFSKAHEYALATRRNLGSLRRRINRHGRQTPTWASGLNAPLLASALLAGEWESTNEGDREVLMALTRVVDWPDFTKTVTQLAAGEDPPLGVLGDHWDFVDIVDAWDAISNLTTPDDIKAFTEVIKDVLTEIEPEGDLTLQERLLLNLDDRPRRRYSDALRRGLCTTLALFGAHTGDHPVVGARTGQELVTQIVRDLLENADETRWLTLTDQLQLLAEAAPNAFLHALETSLRAEKPIVIALFLEKNDSLNTFSAHPALLWALETLAFSPTYVARVVIILARLAVLDPGGKLANRPSASLVSVLHLIHPAGAINATNRLDVLDAVTAAVPEHATRLLQSLVEDRGGGIVHSGPRHRDWPTDRNHATNAEYQAALTGICTRLLKLSGTHGLTTAAGLSSRFSPADLVRVLDALAARWGELEEAHQVEVLNKLAMDVDHHRRYSDAGWAMQAGDLDAINEFLEEHGFDLTAGQDEALFSWESDLDEHGHKDDDPGAPRKTVTERRAEVIKSVLDPGGLVAVIELAAKVDEPGYVGIALADHDADTNEYADEVLDLLGNGESLSGAAANVASAYATRRAEDFTWLTDQVVKRPTQGAVLLRTVRTSAAVLDLLVKLEDDQQALFWKGMNPYRLDSGVVEQVCEGLLGAGRPFSAMTAAAIRDERWPTAELIITILNADLEDTRESAPTDHQRLSYNVGILLNRLEKLGTDDETLANLELYYLPVLEHDRKPRALHRELARKPELFVTMVTSVYKPDHEPNTDVSGAVAGTETGMTDEEFRFSSAAWSLLHGWDGPLPGSTTTRTTPTTEELQAWVNRVRTLLTDTDRSQIASTVIGQALAAPVVDDDEGIWPCEAVRNVIEKELSDDLETGLYINRLNQRGVHGRSIYDGGQQERDLAAKYREDADKVRNRWPRTGAMLDALGRSYNADARREDASAEHFARRHR